jgi:kynureninase
LEILTPSDPDQRGAQLSIKFEKNVYSIHKELEKRGVIVRYIIYISIMKLRLLLIFNLILFYFKQFDLRKPDVLRIAPAPLYNNFNEVYRLVKLLFECIELVNKNATN